MKPLKVEINPITGTYTYVYSIYKEGKDIIVVHRLPFIGCNMERSNIKVFSFEVQDEILKHFDINE